MAATVNIYKLQLLKKVLLPYQNSDKIKQENRPFRMKQEQPSNDAESQMRY